MPGNGAMKEYVVGFIFDTIRQNVLLLLKDRPAWQAGKYNGVGGSSEPGESPVETMRREAWEEVGLMPCNWRHYATLTDARGWAVHFFSATIVDLASASQRESEVPQAFPVNQLPRNVMPNLRWLIPMALSLHEDLAVERFVVNEVAP